MSSIALSAATEQAIEAITARPFHDRGLVWEALQAAGSGVTRIGHRTIMDGNKNLALVGDTALNNSYCQCPFFQC